MVSASCRSPPKAFPWCFFLLVLTLSIPFWLLAAVAGPLDLPVNLPVSALQAMTPLIAAVILIRREEGSASAQALLRRTFDYKRIREKLWYAPVVWLLPVIYALAYGLMRLTDAPLPDHPQLAIVSVPLLFAHLLTRRGE